MAPQVAECFADGGFARAKKGSLSDGAIGMRLEKWSFECQCKMEVISTAAGSQQGGSAFADPLQMAGA